MTPQISRALGRIGAVFELTSGTMDFLEAQVPVDAVTVADLPARLQEMLAEADAEAQHRP